MIKSLKIPTSDLTFYLLSLALCFLVFQQGDLIHTYTSSYAYLNGHFIDFYDFNKVYMERNDYLPGMYIVFALWGLPLKALGLISSPEVVGLNWVNPSPIEIFWFKLLLALLFFGCTFLVYRIGKLICPEQPPNSLSPGLLFATSPIAIFAVFIFSQYDVIGVFFTLLGLYFYFKEKFWRFAFFFSIAISFKYFAALIYLPLVLLIEKRPLHLIKFGLAGILITALQILAYWHSEIFQASFLALARMKTAQGVYGNGGKTLLLAIAYCLICLFAYLTKFNLKSEIRSWARNAILICTLAYAILFTHVHWNPQWLLILMPFFALSALLIRNQKSFICIELFGYIAYIWICVNWYPENVDVTMSQLGILGGYIPKINYFGKNIFPESGLSFAHFFFYLYLYSPFIFWVMENLSTINRALKNGIRRVAPQISSAISGVETMDLPRIQNSTSESPLLVVRIRGFVACYFFLAVTIFCIYQTIK